MKNNTKFFSVIESLMLEGEGANIFISKKEDKMEVIWQPVLAETLETTDDEINQIRANLSTPIRLVDTAENIDAYFSEKMSQVSEARGRLANNFDLLMEQYAEMNKSASNKVNSFKPTKVAAKEPEMQDAGQEPKTEEKPTESLI